MKKRDKFAIAAMPVVMEVMNKYGAKNRVTVQYIDVSDTCYKYADAMMKSRKKTKSNQ